MEKLGCLGWIGLAIVLVLGFTYWYIAIPIGVIALGIWGWYTYKQRPIRKQQQKDEAEQQEKGLQQIRTMGFAPDDDQNPGFILKNNETNYYKSDFQVNWMEQRTHTSRVNYSGVTGRVRLMKGVYWRTGSIKPSRETVTQLEQIHSGKLVLTDKRMVVVEPGGSTSQVMYSSINNIQPFTDALGVMKSRGKDVYLTGNFNYEIVATILLRLLTHDIEPHPIEADVTEEEPGAIEQNNQNSNPDTVTVEEMFENVKQNVTTPIRLNKDHTAIEMSFSNINVKDLVAAFAEDSSATISTAAELVDSIKDSSQSFSKNTDDIAVQIHAFSGDDFEQLIFAAQNGVLVYSIFEDSKFIELVKQYSDTQENESPTNRPDNNKNSANNLTDQLRGLKQLVDDGIITQQEFEAKKKQLLGL